jgi:hypothetical protein
MKDKIEKKTSLKKKKKQVNISEPLKPELILKTHNSLNSRVELN